MKKSDDFIYLNKDQVLYLLNVIQSFKDERPYFNDGIVDQFENYCIERCCEIIGSSRIKLHLVPHAKDFKISRSLFNYLINLTSANVNNKDEILKAKKEVEEKAEEDVKKLYLCKNNFTSKIN